MGEIKLLQSLKLKVCIVMVKEKLYNSKKEAEQEMNKIKEEYNNEIEIKHLSDRVGIRQNVIFNDIECM